MFLIRPVLGHRGPGGGVWPGRCAGSGPARGAAHRGPARTAPGSWFRGSPTSWDRLGTRSATCGRSAPATTIRPASWRPGRPARAGQLGRLGPPGLLAGPLMRPPRPVSCAAAVGGHLPRHRGDRLPQPGGDHGERLPGMQAQGDLLPAGQRQPPRPRHPPIRADRPPRGDAARSARRPDASSPPAGRSPATTGPWPSAATPAAAAPPSDADASATSSAHRESSRLTEALR